MTVILSLAAGLALGAGAAAAFRWLKQQRRSAWVTDDTTLTLLNLDHVRMVTARGTQVVGAWSSMMDLQSPVAFEIVQCHDADTAVRTVAKLARRLHAKPVAIANK